ncbi:hypothetical protein BDR06DRAFT_1012327 [Suillus hirtellus]|nr:hypothetical protein BDR06DRAFT_1012327 [Suillus hirtellus]
MLSSPVSSNPSPKVNSSLNHDKSSQVDAGAKYNHIDLSHVNSYQQSLRENLSSTSVCETLYSTHLPPITSHMSFYAKCAASRLKPYQLGGQVPTALEHCFTMKNILKGSDVDLSEIDVHQGKEIFKRGLKRMTDATVKSAVVAKRADAKCKRLRALATAWELESAEKHAVLLQTLLRDDAEQYAASLEEASLFERMLVKHHKQQLIDDADFSVTAFTYDFASHCMADKQLDHLEEVSAE